MTKAFAAAALILLLAPSAALAQNRGGDAALGALSGGPAPYRRPRAAISWG